MAYMIKKKTQDRPAVFLTNGMSEILEIEDKSVAERLADKLNETSSGIRYEAVPAGVKG